MIPWDEVRGMVQQGIRIENFRMGYSKGMDDT